MLPLEQTVTIEIDSGVVNALDASAEVDICEAKLQDLSALVQDYDGNFEDNEYHRLVARMWHLYLRVERIPVGASSDNEEDEAKKALLARTKELMDNFKSLGPAPGRTLKTSKEPSAAAELPLTFEAPGRTLGLPSLVSKRTISPNKDGAIETQVRAGDQLDKATPDTIPGEPNLTFSALSSHSLRPKYVPVYKWGLTFDNTGPSIAAFLERVEELRRARGVTHQELFESAVDLFAGAALVWYRSSAGRIHSWKQLCKELREVFQPPDYDFRLNHEIFNRLQGEKEPIDLYVAAMEGLYARLSVPVPDIN